MEGRGAPGVRNRRTEPRPQERLRAVVAGMAACGALMPLAAIATLAVWPGGPAQLRGEYATAGYAVFAALALLSSAGAVLAWIGVRAATMADAQARAGSDALRRFRLLTELSPVAIYETDAAGSCLYVNKRWQRMAGMSAQQARGAGWLNGIHPDDRERVARQWREHVNGDIPWDTEYRFVTPAGEVTWVWATAQAVRDGRGAVTGFLGANMDITERKAVEADVRRNERRLQALQDISHYEAESLQDLLDHALDQALFITGSPIGYVYFYDEATKLFTLNTWSKGVMKLCSVTNPQTRYELDKTGIWGEAVRQRRPIVINDFPAPNPLKKGYPEGHAPLDRFLTVPVFSDNRIVAVVGVANKREPYDEGDVRQLGLLMDAVWRIVMRRRAEDALAESRERLAVTLRSIGDAVIATDTAGRVELMNGTAETLTGWTLAEARGRPITDVFVIIDELTRQPRPNPVEQVLASGAVVELANHTVLVARDGREVAVADSGSPIRAADGSVLGVVLVFRDVTDKQRLAENLARAQKLESVGVLAGGIAHDFNNLLGGIFGYIDMAGELLRRGQADKAAATLPKALGVFERAKALTNQLLTFSRGGDPIRETVDMRRLIEETVGFALSGSSMRAAFDINDGLWACTVDRHQVAQVLDNIVINARQATGGSGAIRVRAANIAPEAAPAPLCKGAYVRIDLCDDGPGIRRDDLPRVFDPFFTTRPHGAGLGLAVAHSIVRKHGGLIEAQSQEGHGACFTLFLPANPEAETAHAAPAAVRHRGTGRILVMDDEAHMRELAAVALEKFGYTVDVTADGAEAVARFRSEKEKGSGYVAVLLDLTVPGGMGGREALQHMRAIDPTVRAIVSSGYSQDPVLSEPATYGFGAVLTKPYREEDVNKALTGLFGGV